MKDKEKPSYIYDNPTHPNKENMVGGTVIPADRTARWTEDKKPEKNTANIPMEKLRGTDGKFLIAENSTDEEKFAIATANTALEKGMVKFFSKELEKKLNLNAAKANKILSVWVKKGLVILNDSGKQKFYTFTE